MGEYSGAFVEFDTSQTKRAVAIAEGGGGSEALMRVLTHWPGWLSQNRSVDQN